MKINNLRVNYGNQIIIDDLSFEINKNEIIGILGKNGTGKTTLLNTIVGVKKESHGSIIFSKEEKNIGFLPDSPDSYEYLTGIEFLEVLSDLKGFSITD